MSGAMIYTVMSGGLGDIILSTLHPGCDLGYFKALKERGDMTKVDMWCHHGEQGKTLLGLNPYIDQCEHTKDLPYNLYRHSAGRAGQFRLLTREEKATLPWERPEIYLSPEEQTLADKILSPGPITTFHAFANPGAAREDRAFGNHINLSSMIAALCEGGVRVVLLGGPGEAIACRPHPNLINLIGRPTVRLQTYLVSKSQKFIGGMSCFNCAALEFGVPSIIFAPTDHTRGGDTRRLINEYTFDIFAMMRKTARVYYWDELPANLNQVVVDFGRQS